jgi:hypothetical protein
MILSGDTSGTVTLTVPAVAGTNTVTIPAVTGTAVIGSSAVSAVGQIPFSTDGSSYTPTAKIVSGTAVASTSGTSIDFTGIPSWVKRITVMLNAVSTNGTSVFLTQTGAGSIQNSGYAGQTWTASANYAVPTNGAQLTAAAVAAGSTYQGNIVYNNVSGNIWVITGILSSNSSGANAAISLYGYTVTLTGSLDRVRITTQSGTDTFDAGSINILYE